MKKILFAFSLLFMILMSSGANATEIAVINIGEVLKNSTAMNNLTKTFETKTSNLEKKFRAEEEKLRNEQMQLEGQIQALSNDAKQKKFSEFQGKIIQFQQKLKDENETLKTEYDSSMEQIYSEIKKILADMKNEKSGRFNFDIVVPKESALYSDNSLDVSVEVLSRLNRNLKETKIKK